MRLVNDRLIPRRVGGPVVLPGEGRIDHEALGHGARRITRIEGEVLPLVPDLVAEELVAPANGAAHRLGVGVDEELAVVEAMPAGGLVRPVHPVAVQRAGPHVGQVRVPDVVGPLGHGDGRRRLAGRGFVEEAELDRRGVLGEEREVDALAVPGGPERPRTSGPDPHGDPGSRARRPTPRTRAGHEQGEGMLAGLGADGDGHMFGTVSVKIGRRPPRRAEAVGAAPAVVVTHTTRTPKLVKNDAGLPLFIPDRRRGTRAAGWPR